MSQKKQDVKQDVKQVIVVRKDLNMRKGKTAAQASHSAISFLLKRITGKKTELKLSDVELEWIQTGQTKVCVSVDSEKELLDVFADAKNAGLEVNLITDAGRTEFGGVPTKTCLSIGPDYADKIDKITGDLKLY